MLELIAHASRANREDFLDAGSRPAGPRRSGTPTSPGPTRFYKIDLFQGSGLKQTVDLQEVLRVRLLKVVAILLPAFAIFFAINILDGYFAEEAYGSTFFSHLLVVATTAACIPILSGGRPVSIRDLRWLELLSSSSSRISSPITNGIISDRANGSRASPRGTRPTSSS